jgi:ABC-type multidrug transport system fused ATPase/permease subunit
MVWCDFKTADLMNSLYNDQSEKDRKLKYLERLASEKPSAFELHFFRASGYIMKKWSALAQMSLRERAKGKSVAHLYFLLGLALSNAWLLFTLWSLASGALSGRISVGAFAALAMSTGTALANLDEFYQVLQSLRWRHNLAGHYFTFMSLPDMEDSNDDLGGSIESVEFENVTFSYPGADKPALCGVSFKIESERAALVGENGAGKSTAIKLLCRLYEPSVGRILVNGRDIKDLRLDSLYGGLGVVFQDFGKYHVTLRENVAFGDLSKLWDDEALLSALHKAGAGFGLSLDASLGKIDEDSTDLSLGQWQRIAIARACLPENAFMVLDEPTASLDPAAESRMLEGFMNAGKGRGSLVISHRLASARQADKIIVLEKGAVNDIGTHDELMKRKGLYAMMYEKQSELYQDAGGAIIAGA